MTRNYCKRCAQFIDLRPAVTGRPCPACGTKTVRREGTIKIDAAGLREAVNDIVRGGAHNIAMALQFGDPRLRRWLAGARVDFGGNVTR